MTIANLQSEIIDRIETNVNISADGGVIPIAIASDRGELNPRISVSAERVETNRLNNVQETDASVRVVIDADPQFVEANGTLRLSEIQDAVVDELKNHSSEYTSDGVDSETSVEYSESVERYMCVTEFRFRNYRELNQP
jgi:hypothetical protein